MNRREFLKLSALSTTGVLAANWLFDTGLAHAGTSEIRSSKGVLKATLVAEEQMIPYQGGTRWALTYNGAFPGPTLRVKPGDELRITLVNKLKEPTNLHTHGVNASPAGNSDNPFLMIEPGKTFEYSIKVPKDQTSGTHWFHPHHHHLAAKQVASGMVGVIIVEDKLDNLPIVKSSTERIIVLADPRIGQDETVSESEDMDMMRGRSGPNTLVNGLLRPSFNVKSGAVERWRVVNTCATITQTISVPGAKLLQIATDSARLPRATKVPSISLTPGQRAEFLITVPKMGTFEVLSSTETIASLRFRSKSPRIATNPILPFKKLTKVDGSRTIRVVGPGGGMGGGGMGGGMGGSFTFDGREFDPDRIDQKVKFGDVEDWILVNPSNVSHPFHIHAWPFQVIDDGSGRSLVGWYDTVDLPVRKTVKIRIPFVGVKGKTVYHCHILDHEDMGMMGTVLVE